MVCQRERGASHAVATPPRPRPAVTRRCLRLAAIILATGTGVLAVPATAGAQQAGARQRPWIAITSVTPGYEQAGKKVTISGIVTNPGHSPLRGMSIQLYSSATPLTGKGMDSYLTAAEPTGLDYAIGAQHTLPAAVPARGTEQWSMTLPANQVGMHTFGVYPLAAHLVTGVAGPGIPGTQVDYARTFLPYWPGERAPKSVPPAHPVNIAWVWPLIDTPQQTVCGTLASNELAGSVTGGGRLNSLLTAGRLAGRQAMLTWAIDPALLSDLSAMGRPYRVSGTGKCSAGKRKQASSAARTWLARVQQVAARQDFFTTPYADVDMQALAHSGLDPELGSAIVDGHQASVRTKVPGTQTSVLGRWQRVTPPTVGSIAWPAGGLADYGLLGQLATNGIKTVIMNGNLIHTPATVATVSNALGGEMPVLRANNALTQILSIRRDQIPGLVPGGYATPSKAHTQARQAAAFAKEQWFLAETALIAANAPAAGRAIVVAPPRDWNPLPGMAGQLLNETVDTPWLQPTTLAGLASSHAQTGGASQLAPNRKVTRGELSRPLLGQVKRLDGWIRLLDSILTTSGHRYLSTTVDTAVSSAWRGRKANERPALRLVHADLAYVLGQLNQVSIVGSRHVTLGGQNGVVPVSILNGLNKPVTVKLVAHAPPADHLTIGKVTNPITVQAHQQRTIKISVTAAKASSTTLTLTLTTANGRALPAGTFSLVVVATHFGTLAIVIITIALVVFVVTATARAIRRGGPRDGGSAAEAEEPDAMPSPPDPASARDEPDTVVPGGADDRQPAKEADEHASTPGAADRS